eukprot:TRINITY_DN15945_c0_g1_i1.p1 TRINITY_DN15945_c0_g1~~TRINITY_DN15945_c0_g1_i1.p1  ORF type:complete len:487 (+),score=71.99 TRINITY_DN15945_c0_g1_i1:207-1463(+)
MWGETDYRKALESEGISSNGFLTPVEIFKPHYANAIANFIVSTLKNQGLSEASFSPSQPFHLCEIGGGNATCCVGILDYLKANHPALYVNTKYTSIDVSPFFIERQKAKTQEHGHEGKVEFINKSIFDFDGEYQEYGFVICLEILDNLPHDKLISKFKIANFSEVHVADQIEETTDVKEDKKTAVVREEKRPVEIHQAISDPVIIDFLSSFAKLFGINEKCFIYHDKAFDAKQSAVIWDLLCSPFLPISVPAHDLVGRFKSWVRKVRTAIVYNTGSSPKHAAIYIPTGAFLLFKKLHSSFPRHNVICADFTDLRGSMVGLNGPLVQKTVGNVTTEEASYLTATKGEFDIFFPTDFTLTQILYHMTAISPCSSTTSSTKDFMREFASVSETRTKLGYNPLLEDFSNTAFFIGTKNVINE